MFRIARRSTSGSGTNATVRSIKNGTELIQLIERWLADERKRAENQMRVVDNGFVLGTAGLMLIIVGVAIVGWVPMNILTVAGVIVLTTFVVVMGVQHYMITSYIEGIDGFYMTTMYRIQKELKKSANKKTSNRR